MKIISIVSGVLAPFLITSGDAYVSYREPASVVYHQPAPVAYRPASVSYEKVYHQPAPVAYPEPASVVYHQSAQVAYQPAPVAYQPVPVSYETVHEEIAGCPSMRQDAYTRERAMEGSLPEPTCQFQNPISTQKKFECFCYPGYVRDNSRGVDGPCVLLSKCPVSTLSFSSGPYNPEPKYVTGYSRGPIVTDTRIQNPWYVNSLTDTGFSSGPYNPEPKYVTGISGGQIVTDTRIQNDWDVNPLTYSSAPRW
jgi:hypothetical protein